MYFPETGIKFVMETQTESLEVGFPPEPRTAALARTAVAVMGADLPERVRSDVALLTSEVVSNAITHAALGPSDEITIRITLGSNVRVEVLDPGSMFDPGPRQRTDSKGWGLFFVDTLATAWGIQPERTGKRVWFEMTLD